MSFLKKLGGIVRAIFGSNGFDRAEHETEVRKFRAAEQECHDETRMNLGRMQDAFTDIDLGEVPIERPDDPRSHCGNV